MILSFSEHSKVLLKLPNGNQVFLHYLFPLLHHISSFKDVNQMSTTNLAICLSSPESSPSRTLSRQKEKMNEVTSPGLSYGRPARTVKQPYPMDLSKTARSTNKPATRRQKQVVEIHPNHKPVFTPSYPTESRGQSSSAAGLSSDSNRAAGAVAERPPQKIRMQRKGSEGRVEMAKIKLGLVQDE